MTDTTLTHHHPTIAERMHVPRSRGALTGFLLVLLGIWGALVPFLGPVFGYAFTPDDAWHYTTGRLFLEILPGAATAFGGLVLLGTANRPTAHLGAWLATLAGLWFVVGQPLSALTNDGVPRAGHPAASSVTGVVAEQIGFFYGLGAVIILVAAYALGRMSVVGYRDVAVYDEVPRDENAAHRADRAD